ncbi:hypothetical protein NDU88_007000 [Pleurodeles waltl]|uniref:Uncharacterized protein n=1 Tax=Pleurodeles waltl TaxID=8319 RepID=A0AAV7RP27_PLEWA|nr:hypothetical protein NDU88_007000 [Pleurodeles waltl]
MYAYRAYIESILNYSRDALDTHLSAGLFYRDTEAHLENTALDGDNEGFKKRASFVAGSRQFDLLGHVHSDLFFQDKLLAHAEALQLSNAKYAIERVALKIFSIPAGTRLTQQQNLFLGQLPKLIIIGFVDNTAFSGLYNSNPFNFKHYDINYAALVHEGAVIPAKPFTPNFGTSNFVREYLGLVSITGKQLRDSGVVVSREGYAAGYTLFAFDLMPDMEEGDHYNLIKNGNLKAEIRFTQALATNVNMVVFSVFDSVIQVNHARQLMFDYH